MRSARFDALTVVELHEILRLRADVFVVEQECAYADIDGRDIEAGTVHHWLEHDGRIVAYARTLPEPDGSTRIGRVLTAPSVRGRGHAGDLMRALHHSLTGEIVLDAQSHLAGWYERLGYQPTGDEFVEDGIPHLPMRRRT